MIYIRKYQTQDREKCRQICMDTAKGSFSKNNKKREAVALMYIDYNLDYEPENCFVAVDECNTICGYCVYSCDMPRLKSVIKNNISKKLKKINPVYSLFLKGCTATSIKLSKYYNGGGLHINIDKKYQGQKIGCKLLTVIGRHLKSKGYKFMYLVTKNRKTRSYGFYIHYGFKEARRCALNTLCLTFNLNDIEEKINKYL